MSSAALSKSMEGGDNVCRVIHIRTEHLGPEELLVAAKLEFDGELSMRELADVINEVEAAMRRRSARGACHLSRARRGAERLTW